MDVAADATAADAELLLPSRITNIADPFVKRLAISVHSTNLPEKFEQFFLDECDIFPSGSDDPNALGDGNIEGKEHALEFTAVFERYSKILADHLDAFREAEGVTETEFFAKVAAAHGNDAAAEQFLSMLLAASSYEHFFALMVNMRAEKQRRKK